MVDVKLLIFIITGFFWGGLTAPISIQLAETHGILDIPNERKIHEGIVPRGAGLGIWVGYMLMSIIQAEATPDIRYIATGGTIIFFCGYLDDMCSLSPFLRLVFHFVSALLIVLPLDLTLAQSCWTILWLAGVTSAYNLIDGINGLCLSVFIASMWALYFVGGSYEALYAGAVALGVLCWNFPSAQTFLGDGGSTLLGYLFASHFMFSAMPQVPGISSSRLVMMLVLFGGVPVVDTLVAFTRRACSGKSPFYPDKKHLHHVLISATHSTVVTVSVILLLQLMMLELGLRYFRGLLH